MKRKRIALSLIVDYKEAEIELIKKTLEGKFDVSFEVKQTKDKSKMNIFEAIDCKTNEVIASAKDSHLFKAKDNFVEELSKCYNKLLNSNNKVTALV